jgi:hypothetical protein
MGSALKMSDCRIAKAESWLTEWADAKIRGADIINGYSNKSNISLVSDQGFKVGGQQSRPLIHGRIGADVSVVVDLALKSGMSGRQVKGCIAVFAPGDFSHRERIEASGYCQKGYWNLRQAALNIVIKIKF